MSFITEALDIEITVEAWDGVAMLPFYLSDAYEIKKLMLDCVPCLFMKPREKLDTLTAVKKHIAKVSEVTPLPVTLELDGINAKQRRALIAARIPFVVDESQIYLPFLGMYLQEKYVERKLPRQTLMPSAQMLLFYFLYQKQAEMRTHGTAGKLGLSEMQISRAVKQLHELGLVSVSKYGVQNVITSTESRAALFERAKPYLLNPVRKKTYVDKGVLPSLLPLAGISALSELTMVNAPVARTFAFCGKLGELTGTNDLIDSETQAEIEAWHYNPTPLLQRPGIVDPLSLVVSLRENTEERVKQATENLLAEIWR